MNYGKVDAALAGALGEIADLERPELTVFVHTTGAPTPDQADFLRQCGVPDAAMDRDVFTATVSAQAVRALTDAPWVRFVRLSRRLRTVDQAP